MKKTEGDTWIKNTRLNEGFVSYGDSTHHTPSSGKISQQMTLMAHRLNIQLMKATH